MQSRGSHGVQLVEKQKRCLSHLPAVWGSCTVPRGACRSVLTGCQTPPSPLWEEGGGGREGIEEGEQALHGACLRLAAKVLSYAVLIIMEQAKHKQASGHIFLHPVFVACGQNKTGSSIGNGCTQHFVCCHCFQLAPQRPEAAIFYPSLGLGTKNTKTLDTAQGTAGGAQIQSLGPGAEPEPKSRTVRIFDAGCLFDLWAEGSSNTTISPSSTFSEKG